MNSTIERVYAHAIEAWRRKLIEIRGSFYVNIPMPIVCAHAKRKGSVIEFRRVFDEKSGKVLIVLSL